MKIAMRFVNDMIMMQGLSNPKARSVLVHIVEPLQRQDMQGSHNLDHGLAAPAYGGSFGDVGIAGAAHWRRKDVALCMLIFWCQFWAMISRTGGRLQRRIFSVALCHSAARKAAQDTQNDGSSLAFRCRRGETTRRGPSGPTAQRPTSPNRNFGPPLRHRSFQRWSSPAPWRWRWKKIYRNLASPEN